MFSLTDLPRSDDGLVNRDFIAKHMSSSFTLEGYGFKFVDGVTVEPVTGRTCDRLCAAYGSEVVFVPCDRAVGDAALAWMKRHQVGPQRIERLAGELEELFPVRKPEPVKHATIHPPAEKPAEKQAEQEDEPADFDTDHATPKAKSKHR